MANSESPFLQRDLNSTSIEADHDENSDTDQGGFLALYDFILAAIRFDLIDRTRHRAAGGRLRVDGRGWAIAKVSPHERLRRHI